MPTGTVKWFSDDKGFGFITPDEGDRDLFVHYSGIIGNGRKSLDEGAKVSYEEEQGDKGPKAVNVQRSLKSGRPGRIGSPGLAPPRRWPCGQALLLEGLRRQPDRVVGDGRLQPAAVDRAAGADRAVHRRAGAAERRTSSKACSRTCGGCFPDAAESTLTDLTRRPRRTSRPRLGIAALVASLWIGSSFWGALDTAFCRIYHLPCRSWVEQKRFALAMLVVVLLFMLATVAIPTLQSVLVSGAENLPFGLAEPARARLRGHARRRARGAVRMPVRHLLGRSQGRRSRGGRLARRGRGDARDHDRRLRLPALPEQRLDDSPSSARRWCSS